jgi:hypothetical protein
MAPNIRLKYETLYIKTYMIFRKLIEWNRLNMEAKFFWNKIWKKNPHM